MDAGAGIPGQPLNDITVLAGRVLVARADGAVFETRDGLSWIDRSTLIGMRRLFGTNAGGLWGIDLQGHAWVWTNDSYWEPTTGLGIDAVWVDVTLSYSGRAAFLARDDGSVWSTEDGTLYTKLSDGDFQSLACWYSDLVLGLKRDGSLWIWVNPRQQHQRHP